MYAKTSVRTFETCNFKGQKHIKKIVEYYIYIKKMNRKIVRKCKKKKNNN